MGSVHQLPSSNISKQLSSLIGILTTFRLLDRCLWSTRGLTNLLQPVQTSKNEACWGGLACHMCPRLQVQAFLLGFVLSPDCTTGNHFYKAFSLICYYQWSLLSAANPMGLPNWAVPMGYQNLLAWHFMGCPMTSYGQSLPHIWAIPLLITVTGCLGSFFLKKMLFLSLSQLWTSLVTLFFSVIQIHCQPLFTFINNLAY